MPFLMPPEVQGYIRHVLHVIGMLIVARGGVDQSMMDIYVGAAVNFLSLVWFFYTDFQSRKAKQNQDSEQ